MYEKNLRNYYNANYRKPASDDVRRSFDNEAWIRRSRKHLTTNDESDDELLEAKDYYGPRKKYILTEQSLGGALFLITIAIMIVQLIKIIRTSVQSFRGTEILTSWSKSIHMPVPSIPTYECGGLLWPLLGGLGFTIVSWFLIHFDSNVPGVDPPPPPSFNKHIFKKSSWNFAYGAAAVNGVFVALTIFALH